VAAWRGLSEDDPLAALSLYGDTIDGYDHYHVILKNGVPVVTSWVDAGPNNPLRYARVATYPQLLPDLALGGAYNVARRVKWYVEGDLYDAFIQTYRGTPRTDILRWEDFSPPKNGVKHGEWVEDAMWEGNRAARSIRGWREWVDGVPSEMVKNGQLRDQRLAGRWIKPDGTRTYYHRSVGGFPAFPTGAGVANENELALTTGSATSVVSPNVGVAGKVVWVATTPANEPDSTGVWPAGTYRRQLDCTALGSDLVFGLLPLGNVVGYFSRVNAAVSANVETIAQAEGAFGSPGLSMATCSGWAVAGAQDDRFANVIASVRVTGHGNQTMTLQLDEADDFTDGPWAAAPVSGDNLTGFLSNF
jgi:hypothetical protein